MKYFLSLIMICVLSLTTNAQTDKFNTNKDFELKIDTTVNADTSVIAFYQMPSGLKAIELLVVKASGTLSGKVYLQGSNSNGLNWTNIDSLTVSNVSMSSKNITFTATQWKSYRTYYVTTGTQKCAVIVGVLRRPDEK